MKEDKYYIYCPPIANSILEKLSLEFWKRNNNVLPYNLYQVFPSSPKRAKKALEQLAYNFKREQKYDFAQYSSLEDTDETHLGAFIWVEECLNNDFVDNRVIGGICFRYRDNYIEKEFNGWALQWVYIHPNHRRKGLLSKTWNFFNSKYDKFLVEDPFSTSMYFFLAKNGFPNHIQKDFYDNSPGPKGTMWRVIQSAIDHNHA